MQPLIWTHHISLWFENKERRSTSYSILRVGVFIHSVSHLCNCVVHFIASTCRGPNPTRAAAAAARNRRRSEKQAPRKMRWRNSLKSTTTRISQRYDVWSAFFYFIILFFCGEKKGGGPLWHDYLNTYRICMYPMCVCVQMLKVILDYFTRQKDWMRVRAYKSAIESLSSYKKRVESGTKSQKPFVCVHILMHIDVA